MVLRISFICAATDKGLSAPIPAAIHCHHITHKAKMIAKLLVLAAIASAFVPTAPRATSLTKRFFFDQFIPNPEADAELDGYVGSAKAVLLGA